MVMNLHSCGLVALDTAHLEVDKSTDKKLDLYCESFEL